MQILNCYMKNTLKDLKLIYLGRQGKYFDPKECGSDELYKKGLRVFRGYRFTLVTLNSGLFLQIDYCSRTLQSRNLLEMFNGKPKD